MTKPLHEVVRETQQMEEQFEADAPYLLERLAAPDRTDDDSIIAKLYTHSVIALGKNCDELIALETAQRESAQ